mgnify:CR=1 FL=1
MPLATPFHARTSELCTSLLYKEWAGYHAVRSYDTCHSREYFAFRHAAGLLDVTPLFKYRVRGRGAGALLARVWAKDVSRLAIGRVTYGCWCDDDGKVLDDGTLTRVDDDVYRMTSADPSLAWLERNAHGFDAVIEDQSHTLAALALQGPNSCAVLSAAAGESLAGLRFFHPRRALIGGAPVRLTRTGPTRGPGPGRLVVTAAGQGPPGSASRRARNRRSGSWRASASARVYAARAASGRPSRRQSSARAECASG